jgi:hypothetical protein
MNWSRLTTPLWMAIAILASASSASARVGVASVVEGEPIGIPPSGTERILKIGADMNADG